MNTKVLDDYSEIIKIKERYEKVNNQRYEKVNNPRVRWGDKAIIYEPSANNDDYNKEIMIRIVKEFTMEERNDLTSFVDNMIKDKIETLFAERKKKFIEELADKL